MANLRIDPDKENVHPPDMMTGNDENSAGGGMDFVKDFQRKNVKKLELLLSARANLEQDVHQQRILNEKMRKSIEEVEDDFQSLINSIALEYEDANTLSEELDFLKEDIAQGEQLIEVADNTLALAGIELTDYCIVLARKFGTDHLVQQGSETVNNELNDLKMEATKLNTEIVEMDKEIAKLDDDIPVLSQKMSDLATIKSLLK